MKRHAYLILAHKCDYTLKSLIEMLDSPINDLYIHMDAKFNSFSSNMLPKCKYSKLILTKRTKVSWGSFSVINAELLLLKAATREDEYEYYHLISGEDLPIKSNQYIYNFFNNNRGKEFVRFQNKEFMYWERVKFYYPFQEWAGRGGNIWYIIDRMIIGFQKVFHIYRNDNIFFQKGTQWFSITDDFARYIIDNEKWIKQVFNYTRCCDEVFVQTMIQQSDMWTERLYNNRYDNDLHSIMRLIDWERGCPYTFVESDYTDIINSEMLWARKFNSEKDRNIIIKIKEYVSNNTMPII